MYNKSQIETLDDYHDGIVRIMVDDDEEGLLFGFMDANKNIIVEPQYKKVGIFYEGRANVKDAHTRKWKYIDKQGNDVTDCIFDESYYFCESYALVMVGNHYGYIRLDGSYLVEPKFNNGFSFSEGRARVQASEKDDSWGFIDTNGNYAIIPIYFEAEEFEDGCTLVLLCETYKFMGNLDQYGFIIENN